MTTPDATPQFTDDDLATAMGLISQPITQLTELIVLSDEEIRTIDGVDHEAVTPLPWIEDHADSPEERDLAAAVAMRSLMARGLITSNAVTDPLARTSADEQPMTFEPAPELRGTAVLRRTSDHVVLMERRTASGSVFAFFHVFDLQEGRRVMSEVFDASGFHHFHLMPGDLLMERCERVVDPSGALGTTDTEPVTIPEEDLEASEQVQHLAQAEAVTEVMVMQRGTQTVTAVTLFALADHLEMLERDQEAGAVRVRQISRERLTSLLESLLVTAS